jgi:hypothetical protein
MREKINNYIEIKIYIISIMNYIKEIEEEWAKFDPNLNFKEIDSHADAYFNALILNELNYIQDNIYRTLRNEFDSIELLEEELKKHTYFSLGFFTFLTIEGQKIYNEIKNRQLLYDKTNTEYQTIYKAKINEKKTLWKKMRENESRNELKTLRK